MSDDKPTPIMQITQLALALGALGVGSWGHFKAPDTTAATTTHKWTEAQFEQVIATQAKQHRDLKNLRRYVAGFVQEQYELEEEMIAEEEARPRSRRRPASRRRARRPRAMPSMSDAPTQVKHRSLDDMVHMDESALDHALHELEEAGEIEGVELEEEFDYEDVPQEAMSDTDGPPERPL